MKKNNVKRFLCAACSMMLLGGTCQPVTVMADMANGSFVAVNDSMVSDSITVNGVTVDALYRPYDSTSNTDSTYCCAALVHRFYEQVYGKNVYGLNRVDSVPIMDGGQFVQTAEPKVGDILRDNYSVHWAIVKEVSGNTITLIQQNAWDGSYTKAWVGATVEKGDPRYTFFTWDGNTGGGQSAPAASYTVNYEAPQIQETTAVVSAKIDNPYGVTVYQVGCNIWDAADNLLVRHVEDCVRNETRFNMWYDIQGEIGLALTPGTTYKYQFFVIQDGQEYPGEIQSFTTAGTAPVIEGSEELSGNTENSSLYAEKLVGTWVNEDEPFYPWVLEIYEDSGNLYYDYYSIAPGNSIGIGITKEYTKWEAASGLMKRNELNGWYDCHHNESADSGVRNTFAYDETTDTLEGMEEYGKIFTRNDSYEYQLPTSLDDL